MSNSTAHAAKMVRKSERRAKWHRERQSSPLSILSAATNRHTGKPHQHKAEIARRLRQQGAGA